jgi:predicted transcriptional regulator
LSTEDESQNLEDSEQSYHLLDRPLSSLKLGPVSTIEHSSTIEECLELMQSNKYSSLGIVENEKVVGILTEKDFVTSIGLDYESMKEKPVSEIMRAGRRLLKMSDTISDVVSFMTHYEYRHMIIVDDQDKALHMISISDVLRFIVDAFEDHVVPHGKVLNWRTEGVFIPIENFQFDEVEQRGGIKGSIFIAPMRKAVFKGALRADYKTPIGDVIQLMKKKNNGVVLLTEYETELRGIITLKDCLFKVFKKEDVGDQKILVSDFMTKDPHALLETHVIAHALNNMFKFKYKNIIIVSEDGFPHSVVSLLDILKYIAIEIGIYKIEM